MSPFSTAHTLPRLLLTLAMSTYGLHLSYQNITRLQLYEKQSEKAAEWSNTAAERLYKTRTTQAAGTVSFIISFLASLLLIFLSSPLTIPLPSLALLLSALLLLGRSYMASFWNDKSQTRIPFVEKFNQAIRGSEIAVSLLGVLSFAWGWAGVIWFLEGSWIAAGHAFWGLPVGAFAMRAWQSTSKGTRAK